ncbi:MAG: HAMP domain-containing histidine kinase [Negativicutes bacterium]|nr:HAMP domain-containing histidine kinase [Negativicutes bacterium]
MKIWAKLIAAFLLIVALTVTATTLYSTLTISKAFRAYTRQNFSYRTEMFAAAVIDYYKYNGWQGIEGFVQGGTRGRMMGHGMGPMQRRMGVGMGMGNVLDRYLVIDETGKVIADTLGLETGRQLEPEKIVQGIPLVLEGQQVGTLLSYQGFGQLEEAFITSVRNANLIAGLIAAAAALALGLYLSRKISRPLITLADAAKRLARRELSHRVMISQNDEIGDVAKSFNYMAQQIEQNETLRRHMLADVAHELRTPLAILRGNLESLQDGVIEPKPEVFASLHDETVRMTRLVADLQDLALAEAGELRLCLAPVNLAEVFAKIESKLSAEADARNIRLSVGHPAGLIVKADKERLEQVLYNLLVNAFKYTPGGGEVCLTAIAANGGACITVSDTGTGIPPEDLPHVFNRFYRADKSRNRETGGAGLGLAIVKSFVEAQGGSVGVESEMGQGSRFFVNLPVYK